MCYRANSIFICKADLRCAHGQIDIFICKADLRCAYRIMIEESGVGHWLLWKMYR